MTQEIVIVEKDEESKKTAPKRLTTQNVWEEIEGLKAKIEALYSVIDASNHARIDPEFTDASTLEKISSRVDAIETKITVVESFGEKLDSISSELEKMPSIGTIEGMKVQLQVFSKKLDSLSEALKVSENTASASPKPEVWWGTFSVATPIIAAGAVVSAIPGMSVMVGLGMLLAGGILGAISAIKLWFRPNKPENITAQ